MLTEFEIRDELLSTPRKAWIQHAVSGAASDCLVFLDAELYIERVEAPRIVRELQTAGSLRPTDSVYLSHGDAAARHIDFTCNEEFSLFPGTKLRPWIEQTLGNHARYFLCGLSLSGLSALFTALRHPSVFSGVLSQSPSAWWNDEWLADRVAEGGTCPGRFRISVGNRELQEDVTHPPSGLFQKTCQLDSVRRLAGKLAGSGAEVHFTEFEGGHDPKCWAAELPSALSWLMEIS